MAQIFSNNLFVDLNDHAQENGKKILIAEMNTLFLRRMCLNQVALC